MLNISPQLKEQYGLNSQNLAMFLAQCDYESAGFMHLEENLNYSAKTLLATFPKYFNQKTATQYAYCPMVIANIIYANRMGNGNTSTGDGWKYRGRGYIQLTGKENYQRCGDVLQLDLITNPELLSQPDNATLSALWYWELKRCNDFVPDIEKVTKLINGGLHGINERGNLYKKYLTIL